MTAETTKCVSDTQTKSQIVPKWNNMPKDVSIASMSWEDVYMGVYKKLRRKPTKSEIREIFDAMADRMSDSIWKETSSEFEAIVGKKVEDVLKVAEYDTSKMTTKQLNSKKFCICCEDKQKTYWEIYKCDKNPEGHLQTPEVWNKAHNGDGCSDSYCNPTLETIGCKKTITVEYVNSHQVDEMCVSCKSPIISMHREGTVKVQK